MILWYGAIAFEVVGIVILLVLIYLAPEMPNDGGFNA